MKWSLLRIFCNFISFFNKYYLCLSVSENIVIFSLILTKLYFIYSGFKKNPSYVNTVLKCFCVDQKLYSRFYWCRMNHPKAYCGCGKMFEISFICFMRFFWILYLIHQLNFSMYICVTWAINYEPTYFLYFSNYVNNQCRLILLCKTICFFLYSWLILFDISLMM